MTNSTADRLVDHYLTRLADAAQALPPARRTELLSEIREHIDASMTEGAGPDETSVRTMLDRLGEPDDIIAAAMEIDPPEHPACPPTPLRRQQGIGLEIGAAIMLTAGSLIPILGWLIGVMLLWSSGLWRRSEKILATLVVPGGPGLVLIGGPMALAFGLGASPSSCGGSPAVATAVAALPPSVAGGAQVLPSAVAGGAQIFPAAEACTSSTLAPVLGIALLLFGLVAPVVVAIVLINRARRRAASENQQAQPSSHLASPRMECERDT
jgi:uncharacterized membrane protein